MQNLLDLVWAEGLGAVRLSHGLRDTAEEHVIRSDTNSCLEYPLAACVVEYLPQRPALVCLFPK